MKRLIAPLAVALALTAPAVARADDDLTPAPPATSLSGGAVDTPPPLIVDDPAPAPETAPEPVPVPPPTPAPPVVPYAPPAPVKVKLPKRPDKPRPCVKRGRCHKPPAPPITCAKLKAVGAGPLEYWQRGYGYRCKGPKPLVIVIEWTPA